MLHSNGEWKRKVFILVHGVSPADGRYSLFSGLCLVSGKKCIVLRNLLALQKPCSSRLLVNLRVFYNLWCIKTMVQESYLFILLPHTAIFKLGGLFNILKVVSLSNINH